MANVPLGWFQKVRKICCATENFADFASNYVLSNSDLLSLLAAKVYSWARLSQYRDWEEPSPGRLHEKETFLFRLVIEFPCLGGVDRQGFLAKDMFA